MPVALVQPRTRSEWGKDEKGGKQGDTQTRDRCTPHDQSIVDAYRRDSPDGNRASLRPETPVQFSIGIEDGFVSLELGRRLRCPLPEKIVPRGDQKPTAARETLRRKPHVSNRPMAETPSSLIIVQPFRTLLSILNG